MPDSPKYTVFDGHNDTVLKFIREDGYDFFSRQDNSHIDIVRAKEGGLGGGFFAVFLPNESVRLNFADYRDDDGNIDVPLPDPIELTDALPKAMNIMAHLYRLEREAEGQFKFVRTAEELETCLESGVMAGIMHFEGAEAIDDNLDSLEVFYNAGLRSIGPVWSRANRFAEGVPFRFPATPDTGPGLTDAGNALVKGCNELGIMIDLSHMNEKGFWDVAELTDAPLVATHSNVHAISPVARNLTDKQLDAIKESDGMVGLNFHVGFLREDGQPDSNTPLATMVKHMDYLVERLGVDRVGLGSDFDGATMPDELGDVAGLPKLMQALEDAGYDEETLHKIAHKNWIRVLKKTWKS